MGTQHLVQPGECFTAIARKYGFADYRKIYDDAENAELRRLRSNPDLLFPGDVIVIPQPTLKMVKMETGKVHHIVVKRVKRRVRLRLHDDQGRGLADVPFEVLVGTDVVAKGTTKDDGLVEADVPADCIDVDLRTGAMTRRLRVADLNPMTATKDGGVTGAQARLNNLGYDAGPVDGQVGPRTLAAVRSFRQDAGLDPDGGVDAKLFAALEEAHGC